MLVYSTCHHEPPSKISNLTGLTYICWKDWFLPWQFTLEGIWFAPCSHSCQSFAGEDPSFVSKQFPPGDKAPFFFFWNLSPSDIWKRYFSSPGTGTSSSKSAGWFWDMFFFLGPGIVFRWGLKEKLLLFQKKPSWFEKKTYDPLRTGYQSEEVLGEGKVQQRRWHFCWSGGSGGRWTMFTRNRPHRIHVWYICLGLIDFYGECR